MPAGGGSLAWPLVGGMGKPLATYSDIVFLCWSCFYSSPDTTFMCIGPGRLLKPRVRAPVSQDHGSAGCGA